jgi:hypothetical protein
MRFSPSLALAAFVLGAPCGGPETAAGAGPATAAVADGDETGGEAESTGEEGGGGAVIAGEWRCKAQDNIPIGVLKVKPSGAYEFTVVKNSVWEPKPGDSGNGKGKLGADGELAKPLSGPLVSAYEIIGIARIDDDWGSKIYLNNDFGTLLVCTPASEGG